jgi:hypothetical protein
MIKQTYVNRYRDQIVFEQEGDTILMSGYNPEYCRYGFPNIYTEAYKAYCDVVYEVPDGQPMSLEKFKEVVHEWRDGTNWIMKLFGPLIISDTDTIDMFDPSGGPYMSVGTDMSHFGGGLEGVVTGIKMSEKLVVLTVKK